MVEKDKYLVVVSVLEGRKFPKRAKHQLIVEARFDGELLTTDPVDHGESPDFTQELAWELDKKGLHQHRLQRTSIKVQVYAVDPQSSAKEAVGYMVLDLRSASSAQTSKWYTLLHTKYPRTKPEVKVSLYIDNDKGPQEGSFRVTQVPAKGEQSTLALTPRSLRPILNEAEGFYQIGPPAKCKDMFMLSVTVAFAANLPQLVPTSIPLPATGFFFYYSLLGNDVTNETFRDLLNPNFIPERAAVRIRTSVEALKQFFNSQPGLELHLCCGDQSLGSCDISLNTLLKEGSTEIYMKPVTIEGAFPLHPPSRHKAQMPTVADDLRPMVGVSIVLRKEDQAMNSPPGKDSPKADQRSASPVQTQTTAKQSTPSPRQQKQPKKDQAHGKQNYQPKVKSQKPPSPPPSPPVSPVGGTDGSYTETFETGSGSKTEDNVKSLGAEVREKARHAAEDDSVPERTPEVSPVPAPAEDRDDMITPPPASHPLTQPPVSQPQGGTFNILQTQQHPTEESAGSSTQHHVAVPPQAHHFTAVINLPSVSNLHTRANLFLRYTYPFFGSPAPVMSHPTVEASKGREVSIPQSSCRFDFAALPQQLHEIFHKVPLVVEVWDRRADTSQNCLIGTTQICLAQVFSSQRAKAVHQNGSSGWRQSCYEKLAIQNDQGEVAGELHVGLTLEDWGEVAHTVVVDKESTSLASARSDLPLHQPMTAPQRTKSPEPVVDPRQTAEYRAAMELEMWKQHQTASFETQLKDKEEVYMRALAEEWRRRHKDREVVLQKKVSEYQQLEERLQKTVKDLDSRDRQLAANEQEVLVLRGDLQREHERKMTEMREASRRMKEDCDHQVALQKERVREQEEANGRLKLQLTEAETRYQQLSREFAGFREQQNTKPEVRLQSEINLLTLEKVELERKLEAVTKSKVHYKQQWGRALKELARLKERAQTAALGQLKKQQQELEHMRLRYLATEEKGIVQQERQQLSDIKAQLQEMTEAEAMKSERSSERPMMDSGLNSARLTSEPHDPDDDHITRLIEERDSLLRTGVYTSEDRIIAELDRQIREAIANRGSLSAQRVYAQPS